MIDWRKRYEELELQLEHMLIRMAQVLDSESAPPSQSGTDKPSIRGMIFDDKTNPALVTIVADGNDMEYALYLYLLSGEVKKLPYQRNNTFAIPTFANKVGRSRAFVRMRSNKTKKVSMHERHKRT